MTREYACRNPKCAWFEDRPTMRADVKAECENCGVSMEQIIGAPAVVWTSAPLSSRYRNREGEGFRRKDEGMWAWERNGPDGQPLKAPRPVRLETWKDVHEYSKREHVYDPREIPSNIDSGEDGKGGNLGRGMPGTEV